MENNDVKRSNKSAIIILACFGLFILTPLLIVSFVNISGDDYIVKLNDYVYSDEYKSYETALLLTTDSYDPDNVSMFFKKRLDAVVKLYSKNMVLRILISGDDSDESKTEMYAMRTYLISNGVADRDIHFDINAESVYDSLYRAKNEYKIQKLVIVGQSDYLYRAVYVSNSLGIDTIGCSCGALKGMEAFYASAREFFLKLADYFKCTF